MNKIPDDVLNDSLIDRLKQFAAKPNDNADPLRSIAARLHSRAASQDKHIRDRTLERLWRKNTGTLSLLLGLLETVRDPVTTCSVAGILHECVSSRSGKHRNPAVSQLVSMNATQILAKLVMQQQPKETYLGDSLLQELLWVLSQLAQRDAKFSIKIRLIGAIKTFHCLLRIHYNNSRLLFPLLLVIKALSRNASTTSVLVKDGIISTMEKAIVGMGLSPNAKLRLALNILNCLSKSKVCCVRMVKGGLLGLLLRIFERWDRYDGKVRMRICNYTLGTLQHLCVTRAGRKAMRMTGGLTLLQKFCVTCPDEKAYDPLLMRVCQIINMCLERRLVPVDSPASPATFPLPAVARDCGGDLDLPGHSSSSRETSPDSDDSDDDFQREDDEEHKVDEKGQFFIVPIQRELEELKGYVVHFREYPTSVLEDSLATSSTCKSSVCSSPDLSLSGCGDEPKGAGAASPNHLHMALFHEEVSDVLGNLKNQLQQDSCIKGLATLADIPMHSTMQCVYATVASRVNSVLPFVKVAYPDMVGGDGAGKLEILNVKDRRVCRSKLLTCVDRGLHPAQLLNRIVFDLDSLIASQPGHGDQERLLFNTDKAMLGKKELDKTHLLFESRFEGGNLRKAIQIAPREYDLILTPDVNSTRHLQWFYFEVRNMENDQPYVFNIVNCEKQNSQFNYGMKPVMYSVTESLQGRPGWIRVGSDICYFRNSYQCQGSKSRCYCTTTFTVHFPHAQDVCYLAYHYPYTYSQLMTQIWKWSLLVDSSRTYFRAESLCLSLNNNETPLLTITAPHTETNLLETREVVFLTSRIHPGESNASWVMLGTLNFLLGDSPGAARLRSKYVFKVVPMLNMEGVINGCHRCGLTDEDLNRRWSRPNQYLHPVIYHTKGLMEYCVRVLRKPPYVYCDYHGHSRRKNVFLYGCSNVDSWSEADRLVPDSPVDYLMLPHLMQHFSPAFAIELCSFKVERGRESTARVTMWREFGVRRSYTMESSYCGCDQGLYQGHHLDTLHLQEVGANFCEALSCLQPDSGWRANVLNGGATDVRRFSFATKSDSTQDLSGSLEDSDSSDSLDEYHSFV